MDSKLDNWLPLESNSTVINQYIQTMGASSMLRYYDIVSFDEEGSLYIPQPVFAGLFAYPDSKPIREYSDTLLQSQTAEIDSDLYFMRQTAQNACGTVGLLHALLNIYAENPFLFKDESFISEFLAHTQHMNAEERATYLKECKELNQMHTVAVHAGSVPVNNQTKVNHHFITIIWKNGKVYELDGRKSKPLFYCECKQEDFLEIMFDICQQHYIAQTQPGEMEFNLMVLATDIQ